MNLADTLTPGLARWQRTALLVGVPALALCGVGATLGTTPFFQAYLLGYLFWLGLTLGCFALLALHHLVGGGWGFSIQRVLEAGSRTLPLMIVLGVPLAFGLQELYVWARPEVVSHDAILQHKARYLNVPFFTVRTLVYFALWAVLIFFLNRWSKQQDHSGDLLLTRRLRQVSGPSLVIYVLTLTFASVDWVMSLDPHWYSTIYGVLFVVGQGLLTLAFAIVVVARLVRHQPLAEVVAAKHFHDLGNLMFAFVLLWAYVSFSQFLIIWSGNLPEEIPWYLHRLHGGWQWLSLALVVFHFALPFVLLLSRKMKRRVELLVKVALGMIVMRFADLFWLVVPSLRSEGFALHWLDLAAPVGIGGLWLAWFVWQLRDRPLLPLHDPRVAIAFSHKDHSH
ncbi:MAG: hypothetical protein ONB48_00180 [candidate division KSB1 bacterium]|nr:hypothetical protein [candidate division KSB1 bacterium]MDZ7272909.1 hypothetical protein [candidate division KSB1 bacterium]MDZ7284069.1 hypothetical protein [candidate division KSB1 bacterium]MDZ7297534.1 hypothetical protein [candidate division KSB1 bacterium]MDZ7309106.1 hypothetical protein [candidate division KSB1 bacterium]